MRLLFVIVSLVQAAAQTPSRPLPRFEDFPVKEVFNQTPHPPILVTPEQRLYRTRIRNGVEAGWGVWVNGEWSTEQQRPGPNFAGHFIVIVWGCGAACLRMVICDAITGAVYDPPLSAGGLALPILAPAYAAGSAPDVEYYRDSRLMVIEATPHSDRPNVASYTFYFLWEGNHWKLLRRIPLTVGQ